MAITITLNCVDRRPSSIPMLNVMHNNRIMRAHGAARREVRSRHGRSDIGTALSGPNITPIAKGYGLYAEAITDQKDLGPALKRAIARVKRGGPLLDVLTQPR
jgi:thiamine pyrophosphate-dependent acetolactate synthase large subunit-like protein